MPSATLSLQAASAQRGFQSGHREQLVVAGQNGFGAGVTQTLCLELTHPVKVAGADETDSAHPRRTRPSNPVRGIFKDKACFGGKPEPSGRQQKQIRRGLAVGDLISAVGAVSYTHLTLPTKRIV